MYKLTYCASDTRHGLFADLRKLLEWSWLASEVGNLDLELHTPKYHAERSDVENFIEDIFVNAPEYNAEHDGGWLREKFYVGAEPLRDLLGIDLPERSGNYDDEFWVHNARVSDFPEILERVGLERSSPLWRELQNNPDAYRPTPENDLVRRRCGEALERLVSLRPDLRERIDKFYQSHMAGAGCVVGLHVRFAGHYVDGVFESDEDYYERVLDDADAGISEVKRRGDGAPLVYLATHVEPLVERARGRWGDRLVCRDITRNPTNQDYWFVDEQLTTQLEDAIIDCWLLSKCDALLGGVSNLAYSALILQPELPFHFLGSLAHSRGG